MRVTPLTTSLRIGVADSIDNRLAALLAYFLAGLMLVVHRRVAGTIGFAVRPRRWVAARSLVWPGR